VSKQDNTLTVIFMSNPRGEVGWYEKSGLSSATKLFCIFESSRDFFSRFWEATLKNKNRIKWISHMRVRRYIRVPLVLPWIEILKREIVAVERAFGWRMLLATWKWELLYKLNGSRKRVLFTATFPSPFGSSRRAYNLRVANKWSTVLKGPCPSNLAPARDILRWYKKCGVQTRALNSFRAPKRVWNFG
jgi:hypothetical protein